MPDEPNPTGGGSGEPVAQPAPVADASQQGDAELLASLDKDQAQGQPDPKADLWKQLGEIDPRELPENIRQKFEAPFLSQYGKKTSELDNERQRLLAVVERLVTKPGDQPPSVDQKKALLDEIANGNTEAIAGLVDKLVQEQTKPTLDYVNSMRAIQEAKSVIPEFEKYDPQMGESIRRDPVLARMIETDNRAFASRTLAGIAAFHRMQDLEAQLKAERAASDTKARKAVEDYKLQLRGLPTSTSQAGKTPTAFTPAKPMTEAEMREAAWEAGLAGSRAKAG